MTEKVQSPEEVTYLSESKGLMTPKQIPRHPLTQQSGALSHHVTVHCEAVVGWRQIVVPSSELAKHNAIASSIYTGRLCLIY